MVSKLDQNAWYVVVEGLTMSDVLYGPYVTEVEAKNAMETDPDVRASVEEDSGDCWYQQGPPESFLVLGTWPDEKTD